MGKFAPPHWRSACEKLPTVGQTAIFCLIPKVGDETDLEDYRDVAQPVTAEQAVIRSQPRNRRWTPSPSRIPIHIGVCRYLSWFSGAKRAR
jgi:hypothetical protein